MKRERQTSRGGDLLNPKELFSVLLVEDDKVTLRSVEQMLKKFGKYSVTTAVNGRIAQQLLRESKAEGRKAFDLILADLVLPEVSGFDLIHEALDVPIVVMSSHDSRESVLKAFEAGAADYLIKPIRRNEVSTLWQHIWRNNKLRAAHLASSGAPSVVPSSPINASIVGNDSGASTTDEMDQSTFISFGRFPRTSWQENGQTGAPSQAGQNTLNSASKHLARAAHANNSGGTSRQPPPSDTLVHGAAVAAVHLDISDSGGVQLLQGKTIAQGGIDLSALSPYAKTGLSNTFPNGSSGSSPDQRYQNPDATHSQGSKMPPFSKDLKSPFSKDPKSAPVRPHATSTSQASGQHQLLPPGLQELASLGQYRHFSPATGAQNIVSEQVSKETQPGVLNHSGRSPFTAVTVFLPRPEGSTSVVPGAGKVAPGYVPGVLLPSLPPLNMESGLDVKKMAGDAQPYKTKDCTNFAHSGLQQSRSIQSLRLPPVPQLAPGQVFLPDSVVHLIAALSGKPMAEACMPHGPTPGAVPGLWVGKVPSSQGDDTFKAISTRQAAVAKYLIKRKNRTFKKKVRYESRKRLAESRPRVRGQFVKREVEGTPSQQVESCKAQSDKEHCVAETLAGMASFEEGASEQGEDPMSESL